ncbi:flagellar assembly protein FliW [Stomatohabitans albus]|uniref:flagellar assembly protein FliW n=1 Tax=Stomatohabitans albus TaxID=3110766 RepID=UPI00300D394C
MFSALADPGTVIPLSFVAAMPGFPDVSGWGIANWGDPESPFKTLSAIDGKGPSFVMVELGVFWPTAEIELDETTIELLGIESPEDVALFAILTLGDSLETTTANLLGPIVVNVNNQHAVQMIRTNTHHSTREPLIPQAS